MAERSPGQGILFTRDNIQDEIKRNSVVVSEIKPQQTVWNGLQPRVVVYSNIRIQEFDDSHLVSPEGNLTEVSAFVSWYDYTFSLGPIKQHLIDVPSYIENYMRQGVGEWSHTMDWRFLLDSFASIDFTDTDYLAADGETYNLALYNNVAATYTKTGVAANVLGLTWEHFVRTRELINRHNIAKDRSRLIVILPENARGFIDGDSRNSYYQAGTPLASENGVYMYQKYGFEIHYMNDSYFESNPAFYSANIDGLGNPGYYGFAFPYSAIFTCGTPKALNDLSGVLSVSTYKHSTEREEYHMIGAMGCTNVHPEMCIRIAYRVTK